MSAPRFVVLEKPVGQTPLQAIEVWKAARLEFADVPATYAGRLDPMASGKLLVLLGDECKERAYYTGLDKEYEIEVVLDLSTDTGDALGIPSLEDSETKPSNAVVKNALRILSGSHSVPYPAFSSKTVNGIPLFLYALRGELDSIDIPTHIETLYRADLLNLIQISKKELQARIESHLQTVPTSDEPSKGLGNDFRQHDIRARWNELFETMPERSFTIVALRVTCASGTYMRTLATRIANELGTTAFALSIHRTNIGRYKKFGPFGFWSKRY